MRRADRRARICYVHIWSTPPPEHGVFSVDTPHVDASNVWNNLTKSLKKSVYANFRFLPHRGTQPSDVKILWIENQ